MPGKWCGKELCSFYFLFKHIYNIRKFLNLKHKIFYFLNLTKHCTNFAIIFHRDIKASYIVTTKKRPMQFGPIAACLALTINNKRRSKKAFYFLKLVITFGQFSSSNLPNST